MHIKLEKKNNNYKKHKKNKGKSNWVFVVPHLGYIVPRSMFQLGKISGKYPYSNNSYMERLFKLQKMCKI